ncbi:hypothetical protein VKS41_001044 [Umbelopsis sp. WA50703]|jgi:transcriptional regulator GlxA family with amidase domain
MTQTAPKTFGYLLYPGFALLDVCGPLEIFTALSSVVPIEMFLIALDSLEPVSSRVSAESIPGFVGSPMEKVIPMPTLEQRIVPTHTLDTVPDLDVLIIPGGFGGGAAAQNPKVLEFIKNTKARNIITVCNGAPILAATGLLDGHRATTNKWFYEYITQLRPQVNWVPKARWVHDGRYWTSSGVTAGMDVAAAYIREVFGEKVGELCTDIMEYSPELNSDNDPFCDIEKKYVPPQDQQ